MVLTGNPPDYLGGMSTESPGMRYLQASDKYSVQIDGLGVLDCEISQ